MSYNLEFAKQATIQNIYFTKFINEIRKIISSRPRPGPGPLNRALLIRGNGGEGTLGFSITRTIIGKIILYTK